MELSHSIVEQIVANEINQTINYMIRLQVYICDIFGGYKLNITVLDVFHCEGYGYFFKLNVLSDSIYLCLKSVKSVCHSYTSMTGLVYLKLSFLIGSTNLNKKFNDIFICNL